MESRNQNGRARQIDTQAGRMKRSLPHSNNAVRRVLRRAVCTAVLLCALFPASGQNSPASRRAFYYWRTVLNWNTSDTEFARATGAERIYVRVFDVDISGTRAVPRAPLRIVSRPPLEIVPVVFVRPYVVSRLSQNDLRDLASSIVSKTQELVGEYAELQIDCDWTPSTRENFFFLLRAIRHKIPPNVILSATIRLHQVKFRDRTGIPPVDRGALMVYGMTPPSDPHTTNSILSLSEASLYLAGQSPYELPLDGAVPVYSSAVLFHNGRFRRLLGEVEEMPGAGFVHRGNWFCVKEATEWQGAALVKGDCVRVEIADPKLAMQLRDLVLPLMKGDSRVILFHYSPGLIRHGTTDIRRVFDAFRIPAP
jgi:hypothetical protein